MLKIETIKLPDSRSLCYSQYGELDGKPVFFFHGTPGSRFFHPPISITKNYGVRLITVDRPGYGQSSFQPNRKILDWPEDIRHLADELKLENFHVAGHSGGGPYVLACAKKLQKRVNSASIISSIGPVEAIPQVTGFSGIKRLGLMYGRYIPWWSWKILISLLFRNRSRDPLKDIKQQEGNRPHADLVLMNDPGIRENCHRSELEAFKPGLSGLAWDAWLLTKPWGFRIEEIRSPVWIWHGTADDQAPVAMAKYLTDHITSSISRILPGEAHLMLFQFWDDILESLLTNSG